MQTMSPARYEQALAQGEYQPDDVQRAAISRPDAIQRALSDRSQTMPTANGWRGKLSKLLGKEKNGGEPPVRGLYMWGGVGRGKTRVMDLFFSLFPASASYDSISIALCCGCMKNSPRCRRKRSAGNSR